MADAPKRPPLNYDKAWTDIRPYVSFRLQKRKGQAYTASDRRKIRKYSELIGELTSRPYKLYIPRSKNRKRRESNLRKVQYYAQHPSGFDDLKVAFVPNPDGIPTKIRINKNSVTLTGGGVRRRVWFFKDMPGGQAMIFKDPEAVERFIDKHARTSREFAMANGVHEVDRLTKGLIGEQIRSYVEKYGQANLGKPIGKNGRKILDSNLARNWLIGVVGYNFLDQASLAEYKEASGKGGFKKSKKRQPPKGREGER